MKNLFLFTLFIFTSVISFGQCSVIATLTYSGNGPSVNFGSGVTGTNGYVHYLWNFGDGSPTDTGRLPIHTYPTYGSYTTCVSITDSLGCTDSSCYPISFPSPAIAIGIFEVDTSITYYSFCSAPQQVHFDAYLSVQSISSTDSILFDINFGDGIDSLFYLSPNLSQYIYAKHTFLNPGTYTPRLIISNPTASSDTAYSITVTITSSCGPVSGRVYNDLNGNCILDPGEQLSGISLMIYDGQTPRGWAISDLNGKYSFSIDTGLSYDIRVKSYGGYVNHYVPVCPSSGSIHISSVPSSGNNFGVHCPPGFDLQGGLTGWHFRPGFIAEICPFVFNQFCDSITGSVQIVLPPGLTALPDTNGTAYTINGDTVTYALSNSNSYWNFCFQALVSSSLQIWDTVCFNMLISPVVGDSVPSNNNVTYCFPLIGSFDPNDKYAVPAGEGTQNSILPNTSLTYTIRFQNTGTADAVNIYILDTLDASLDPSTVEIMASSHSMSWLLLTGNILRFNFDNVNLPDSIASEPASHGYVTYRINQLPNVGQLTQIHNSASIYFDYNQPIYTNQTTHTIDYTLATKEVEKNNSSVRLYPNPSNEKCYLSFTNGDSKILTVIDVTGKEIYFKQFTGDSFILNTSKFANGIYSVWINGKSNEVSVVKLTVAH